MGWTTLIFFFLTLGGVALGVWAGLSVKVAEDNWDVVGAWILTGLLAVITLILFIIWIAVT